MSALDLTDLPGPLPRRTLRGEAQQRLRAFIVDGRLQPGANVVERDLSEQLGVSRTPLREALLGLEAEGLLRTEPGRGFFVAALSLGDAREIYPLIATLEALAIATGRPTRLGPLVDANARLRTASSAAQALMWDRDWHEALIRACDQPRTAAILDGLRTSAARFEYRFFSEARAITRSADQHDDIREALERKRFKDAAALVRANWQQGLEWVERTFGKPAGME
jgi:DNA-binding GntR family transcriptional regulator